MSEVPKSGMVTRGQRRNPGQVQVEINRQVAQDEKEAKVAKRHNKKNMTRAKAVKDVESLEAELRHAKAARELNLLRPGNLEDEPSTPGPCKSGDESDDDNDDDNDNDDDDGPGHQKRRAGRKQSGNPKAGTKRKAGVKGKSKAAVVHSDSESDLTPVKETPKVTKTRPKAQPKSAKERTSMSVTNGQKVSDLTYP